LEQSLSQPADCLAAGQILPAPHRTGTGRARATASGVIEPMTFEEVEHTADRALRIHGRNLAELFVNAAAGMNSLVLASGCEVLGSVAKPIELEAIDAESLLVAWLSELAFWAETEALVFNRFDFIELSPARLKAVAHGSPVRALEKHVKAVTFHNLAIRRGAEGLVVTVVFDV
jgi:SHS2 domain-containing protein